MIDKPKYDYYRVDAKNGRFYGLPGNYVPSATHLINKTVAKGDQFNHWLMTAGVEGSKEVLDRTSKIGTMVHSVCMYLSRGEEVNLATSYVDDDGNILEDGEECIDITEKSPLCVPAVQKRVMGFLKFWGEKNPVTLASELVLYHPDCDFAGTADLICTIGGETWLIDYKTGSSLHPEHKIQVMMYKYLYEWIYGSKIDKIGLLHLKDSWKVKKGMTSDDINQATYTLKEVSYDEGVLLATVDMFKFLYPNLKPYEEISFPKVFNVK